MTPAEARERDERADDERQMLEEILKTEPDLTRRREAERRYLAITETEKEQAA